MFEWQSSYTVVIVLFVCHALLYGLLLTWAGLGSANYVWRYGAVLAWLAVWLPAEINDVGSLSLVQAGIVLPVLQVTRLWSGRNIDSRQSWGRFGVRDILKLILLSGGALGIGLRLPHYVESHVMASCALMLAALTLVSIWLALGTKRLAWRLATFFAVSIAIWCAWRYVEDFRGTVDAPIFSYWYMIDHVPASVVTSLLVYGFTAGMVLILTLVRLSKCETEQRRFARPMASVLVLAPLSLSAWHYFHLVIPISIPHENYPNPNSYDAIAQFTRKWENVTVPHPDVDGKPACVAFVKEHGDELRAFCDTARLPGKVRLVYEKDGLKFTRWLTAHKVQNAIRLLGVDAPPAMRADLALTTLDHSYSTSHGGLYLDYFAAYQFDATSAHDVILAGRELGPDACRAFIKRVAAYEEFGEPEEVIAERDKVFCLIVGGWKDRSSWAAARLIGADMMREVKKMMRQWEVQRLAHLRIAQADIAINAYRKQHNTWPKFLDALVPEFFAQAPIDPYVHQPLRYVVKGDSYLLYSVGENLIDDGGLRDRELMAVGKGDVFLDP
jgi:hypothetical protein